MIKEMISSLLLYKKERKNFLKMSLQGFTLIEMMVALFIMSVSTVLLLANYPDSTVRLGLLNDTHEVALLIREAQLRGSSIDSNEGKIAGYGIFLSNSVGYDTEATLFGDASVPGSHDVNGFPKGDSIYDDGVTDFIGLKDIMKLEKRSVFSKLCVASSTAFPRPLSGKDYFCESINGYPLIPFSDITISFVRPSPTPHIYINNDITTDYSGACIQIATPKTPQPGHVRSIKLYHSGMTTTDLDSCD